MSITQLESRRDRIDALSKRWENVPHHRCYYVALRNAHWRVLVKLRNAKQRAGWGTTQNASLPAFGGADERFIQLAR